MTQSEEDSVVLALDKGCDLNCGCTYQKIMLAYKKGILPLEHIKRSAIRLFTTRFLLGMFDETEFDNIPYEKVECKEHLALSEKAAKESKQAVEKIKQENPDIQDILGVRSEQ